MPNKEIGGYFGLELNEGEEYYPDAIKLNSARNCFKYILISQKPKKVYVPYYIDKSMREDSLMNLGVKFEFYHIDKKFEIAEDLEVRQDEKILYNNYYSLKSEYIGKLVAIYGKRLIVDNTHAFFCKPIAGIDTIYSLGSKYFGVPNGGYLYTDTKMDITFEYDVTYDKMRHLLGRIDVSAEAFFNDFQQSKKWRNNQEIRYMSKLTQAILKSIDYKRVKLIRERNFYYLHSFLKRYNLLEFDDTNIIGPSFYPLLIEHESLRQTLIENKIYVPTFWKEILEMEGPSEWEKYVSKYLLPLPIDQRYDLEDIKRIVQTINKVLGQ